MGPKTTGLINEYMRMLSMTHAPATTQKTVLSVLTIVQTYIAKPLDCATRRDLEKWQERRAAELSPRSLRTQIGTVRAFFRWAADQEFISVNPAAQLRAPRVGQTLPRPIPEHRLAKAYLAADERMKAILCLQAFAGLRAKEVAGLAWSDVFLDCDEPHIFVTGKGAHERTVDVSPDLAHALLSLPHRRGPVIRRADGQPGHNTPNNVSQVVGRFFRSCGIHDTPHSMRHRAITEVCRIGGPRQAQEFAGHAHMGVTSVYTKVIRGDLRPTVVAAGKLLVSPTETQAS